MISNASLSAFSPVPGAPAAARPNAAGGATRGAGAATDQLREKLAPGGGQGLQVKPGQLAPGQILPRGSLLDRSV